MPAHRKPTALLKLAGSDRKDPQRYRGRKHEPKPDGPLGACPRKFGQAQKEVAQAWNAIAENCPAGVLTAMDRVAVQLAAALLAEFWRDPFAFQAAKHTRQHSLLGAFGMTPSDRTRVSVPPRGEGEVNRFARFGPRARGEHA